jgi:pentatricopeptide repeat protein
MFINQIELKNFRRFSDLKIELSELMQNPPKLVLLIGANGSGKTCVFDAFEAISAISKGETNQHEKLNFYRKQKGNEFSVRATFETQDQGYSLLRVDNNYQPPLDLSGKFYGRSSFRQIPMLTRTTMGSTVDFEKDSDRPQMYIERDNRFENDVEKITESIMKDIFYPKDEKLPISEVKEKYINPINNAFKNIFGNGNDGTLRLTEILPPTDGQPAKINFKKGDFQFHYNFLSSGEKEVFNILINLLTRRKYYQDTIYFFDEMDLHLNTALQYSLIKEVTENWIPENCQLWTASHSLGFIDYANDHDDAAILDFDDLDFDQPQALYPKEKNTYDVFEIAVSKKFLTKALKGKKIVFCENKDAGIYNNLGFSDTLFFRANDKRDAFFKSLNMGVDALIDRDYLSNEEIQQIENIYPNIHLLRFYSIENYLLHPDNLDEHFSKMGRPFDKKGYIEEITKCKDQKKRHLIFLMQTARNSYPFYRDPDHTNKREEFDKSGEGCAMMLDSDDFDTFYPVFPIKDYCRQLPHRQNLNSQKLGQTKWFKGQIERALK